MYIFLGNVHSHKISLVPYIIGIHPYMLPFGSQDSQVVVVTLIKQEMYFSIDCTIFLMVCQVHFIKGYPGKNLGPGGKRVCSSVSKVSDRKLT